MNHKLAIRYGIIAGLLFAALCYGCWAGGTKVFAGFLVLYTLIPLIFVIVLIGAFRKRKQLGGYMSLKEALAFAFLAYVIYEIFYAVATMVLFKAVDPQLQDKVVKHITETSRGFMERLGASDSQIDDTLKSSQEGGDNYSFKQILIGFGMSLIYDFIKSVIIALISQRRKPDFAVPQR